MARFFGEHRAKADDKGRLVFPSAFKALLPSDGSVQLVVKKDAFDQCLNIFTFDEWNSRLEEVKAKLNTHKRDHSRLWRAYTSGIAIVSPEGKFGRIMIPRHMLESIGVVKEVVFSGCDFKIELWAKDKYEAEAMSDQEFSEMVEKILGQ